MNASARPCRFLQERIPEPSFLRIFLVYWGLAALIFLRPINTNFIFDEQEALLGNPYLWGELPFHRVLEVDFWGRAPARTIGSYRPLPNLLWRTLSWSLNYNTPWLLSLWNLVIHALTAAFLVRAYVGFLPRQNTLEVTSRPRQKWRGSLSTAGDQVGAAGAQLDCGEGARSLAPRIRGAGPPPKNPWLLGILFTTSAVSCEAVCGVVGLADLLVGLFAAFSLWCLVWIPGRVLLLLLLFCASFLGCLSKETMLSVFPVLVLLALFLPSLKPQARVQQPSPKLLGSKKIDVRLALTVGAALGAGQIAAVLVRKSFFPTPRLLSEPVQGVWAGAVEHLARWWALPPWPFDPLNNPTLAVGVSERLATAAAIYVEQLVQFVVPLELVGDYSAPRQAVHGWDALAVFGAILFGASCVWALANLGSSSPIRRGLAASGLWVSLCFSPVSGAAMALPTIRAERLFYSASLGAVLFLFLLYTCLWRAVSRIEMQAHSRRKPIAKALVSATLILFVSFQTIQARRHAFDYSSDLAFWRAASSGENASAKSFLNRGVMLGARGDLEARRLLTERALRAAPDWAMGKIYLADTYCRQDKLDLARPYYFAGLSASADSKSLTALSLQCIWDHGMFDVWLDELRELAKPHPDSWLDYFVYEIEHRGEEHDGISPEHRPRQYNRRSVQR